ncbi:hypothetical protein DL766_009971 [Monosporascus sp. MC13-8B]|nr:hypothetical protein DL763_001746 [Monosporascus cannonballus]RYP12362.1 hypothetical protein DL766_009971 [Monosporascus sp. MC13-8B]
MAPSTDPSIWTQGITIPENAISYIDEAVKPVLSIEPSGSSYWARTAKISTIGQDGREVAYFAKAHQGQIGQDMVFGEYQATKALWDVMPEMVARPYGYGTYEKTEDIHFILLSFRNLTNSTRDIHDFPPLVAELICLGVPHSVYGNPGGYEETRREVPDGYEGWLSSTERAQKDNAPSRQATVWVSGME